MTSKTFSVSVGDLEDGPKELKGPLSQDWMKNILKDTDVRPFGDTDGTIDVVLTKNGPEVLVQGRLDLTISVPCARTLDPAIYRLRPEVFLMLAPAGGAPAGRRSPRLRPEKKAARARKPAQQGKKGGWEADPVLSDEEAAQDTYTGDQIVLDDFLREFILLELPMLPLREDLRDVPFEGNPPLPEASDASGSDGEKPLDPRLSPLQAIKARLEKKE